MFTDLNDTETYIVWVFLFLYLSLSINLPQVLSGTDALISTHFILQMIDTHETKYLVFK